MKKILAIVLACAMLIPASVFFALADASGVSFGNVPHVSDSDITVDGNNDDPAWANALTLQINVLDTNDSADPDSTTFATGTCQLLWSDDAIYAFYAINDPTIIAPDPDNQQNSPWMCDSVELFLDPTNGGTTVFQYRVDRANFPSFDNRIDGVDNGLTGPDADQCPTVMTWASRVDDANHMYYVELKANTAGISAGSKVGLQLQINDMVDDTNREVVREANSQDALSWDMTMYDYITLDATSAVPATTAAPDTTAAGGGDVAATTAPATSPTTGDNGIVAIVLVAIAALGAAVVTGKVVARKRG